MPQAFVGSRAPDFSLPCTRPPGRDSDQVQLADFLDRWLVVLFYPRDFSLVCPTEISAVSVRIAEFHNRDCDVLGISTDDLETHDRWIRTPKSQGGLGGIAFPLASDVTGEVSKAYGVLLPRKKVALRGVFIIDPNGVLQYQVVHNLSVGRRTDEVLRVLDALQSGGLCPENWSPGDELIDPAKSIGPGSVLGPFHIQELIGDGAFGSVFRARDTLLERPVAVKVVSRSAEHSLDRIFSEARAAAAIAHPNVCTVFSVDSSEGLPLIVMEYIDGESLAKRIERNPLAEPEVADLFSQISQGLSAAHAHRIVHGDLKPANIMLTSSGRAKIMDFGLARRVPDESATIETVVFGNGQRTVSGTPCYMSPEQTRGETLTPASDLFSLGLVLFEMLTGQRAIHGKNISHAMEQVVKLDAESLAARVAERWQSLLRMLLHRDPQQRSLGIESRFD